MITIQEYAETAELVYGEEDVAEVANEQLKLFMDLAHVLRRQEVLRANVKSRALSDLAASILMAQNTYMINKLQYSITLNRVVLQALRLPRAEA
jgi:hypothetical protein